MPLRVLSRKELRFIIWYQVGRLIYFEIVEAETFEAIDEMFEPIRAMTDAVINPVMAFSAS